MDDISYDKLLRIKTTGRDDTNADRYHFPYEPTPYPVLERLANSGYLKKANTLIDYGCGKGRVDFFLSYQTRCRSIGIEYDRRIFETVKSNTLTAASSGRCSFFCENAEDFALPPEADRLYFFNPFSVELLGKVLKRVRESFYDAPRELYFFFYYPSNEYISFLLDFNDLELVDEINCGDLFEGENPREKIMIFQMK